MAAGKPEPTDYWISNLPADTEPERLARLARLRWKIELDYKQLKGELGHRHYEPLLDQLAPPHRPRPPPPTPSSHWSASTQKMTCDGDLLGTSVVEHARS